MFRESIFNLPSGACLLQIQQWFEYEENTALKIALKITLQVPALHHNLFKTIRSYFVADISPAGQAHGRLRRLRMDESIFPSERSLCSFCHGRNLLMLLSCHGRNLLMLFLSCPSVAPAEGQCLCTGGQGSLTAPQEFVSRPASSTRVYFCFRGVCEVVPGRSGNASLWTGLALRVCRALGASRVCRA